jgi:hypothetical protein
MPVDFHGRKEQASGGVGGGEREFAKNLRRERSSFLFCFVGVGFLPSLRRALFLSVSVFLHSCREQTRARASEKTRSRHRGWLPRCSLLLLGTRLQEENKELVVLVVFLLLN